MGSTDFDGLGSFTIYIVYLPNNLTNAQTLVSNAAFPNHMSLRLYVDTDGTVRLQCSADGSFPTGTPGLSTGVGGLLLNSPNLIIVSRDATAGAVTTIINGHMTKETGLLTGALFNPTADFHVSGYFNNPNVVQQIRGAVAALVIQETPDVDENIVDYLRAVYGVN